MKSRSYPLNASIANERPRVKSDVHNSGGPSGLIWILFNLDWHTGRIYDTRRTGFDVCIPNKDEHFVLADNTYNRAPTSGGQYYWVAILAPESSRRFLSYITGKFSLVQPEQLAVLTAVGWLTVIGWQAASASVGYLAGTLVQRLITLNNPSYHAEGWQGTLLFWAVILVAVAINTVVVSALPKIEGLILVIHILGFFAILIPLVYLAKPVPAQQVFALFLNLGNWDTQGLSFFIGLAGLAFAFLGTCCLPRPGFKG